MSASRKGGAVSFKSYVLDINFAIRKHTVALYRGYKHCPKDKIELPPLQQYNDIAFFKVLQFFNQKSFKNVIVLASHTGRVRRRG